jgi:hypothetical protein
MMEYIQEWVLTAIQKSASVGVQATSNTLDELCLIDRWSTRSPATPCNTRCPSEQWVERFRESAVITEQTRFNIAPTISI